MKFDELPLLQAIYSLRLEMRATGEEPCAEYWTTEESRRIELTQRVMQKLLLDTDQRIIDAWTRFRKQSKVGGLNKFELACQVAATHGCGCFYRHRGLGECSDEFDVERLIPASRGGEYTVANCVLACARHNRMRGDTPLEAFLSRSAEATITED